MRIAGATPDALNLARDQLQDRRSNLELRWEKKSVKYVLEPHNGDLTPYGKYGIIYV